MTLVEALTVAGLIVGPLSAVVVTLWIEDGHQKRQRRLNAARALLVGRLNLADPAFQFAIAAIPIDFAGDDRVIAAHNNFLVATRQGDRTDSTTQQRWNTAQIGLTTAVLRSLGYSETEAGQIANEPYYSGAAFDQGKLQTDALNAVIKIAENTTPRPPPPTDLPPPNRSRG